MKKVLLILMTLLISLSCTRREPVREEDQLRRIQSRIDQKNYDAAEKELHAILDQEPDNQRARVILASLYVSKAGITLKDYFALEKLSHLDTAQIPSVLDLSVLKKMEQPEAPDFSEWVEFLSGVNEVVSRCQEISEKFQQIPVLDDSGAENLSLALAELAKIDNDKITDGNALYRGVIKVFYFKYLWKTEKLLSFGEQKFCSQTVAVLADRLGQMESFIVGMMKDVARGFPKKSGPFQEELTRFDQSFKRSKAWLKGQKEAQQSLKEVTEKMAADQSIQGFKCDF